MNVKDNRSFWFYLLLTFLTADSTRSTSGMFMWKT